MTKLEALIKHLELSPEDAEGIDENSDGDTFTYGREEYLVLTDSEADEKAKEYIKQSLWAFNAEFIASHTVKGLSNNAIKALRKAQGELCEDANDLVESMINDLDHFMDDAISADGRGHFMSTYDGEENEQGEFFIYRTN